MAVTQRTAAAALRPPPLLQREQRRACGTRRRVRCRPVARQRLAARAPRAPASAGSAALERASGSRTSKKLSGDVGGGPLAGLFDGAEAIKRPSGAAKVGDSRTSRTLLSERRLTTQRRRGSSGVFRTSSGQWDGSCASGAPSGNRHSTKVRVGHPGYDLGAQQQWPPPQPKCATGMTVH